ncbi:unnamed protein product [Rotaria sp. Silwood2]|nr:unnamed protein product [Rotaria sp. Silwood2]CAF3138190.1 unnamed protein product [Rotaria sp. Silwood2]CAF3154143.1 unnamed protein product [Rotaria sp. Silwood2]
MIAIPIQSPVVLQRQKTGEARQEVISSTATANSSATTCSTGISTLTTTNSMTKWKNDFVVELLKLKNQLLNNPFFSVERYKQTIELINNAKLKIPDIDRGLTDARNVLAATMKIKHDKYKLGTEQGVLHDYYSFHQLSKAPRTPTL